MPVACARCGAQNADGNGYCQACGAQLTAQSGGVATSTIPGPPPGPPPGAAAPIYSQDAYRSPYYTPAAPGTAVRRTPWALIVGAIVAFAVVVAGIGTAFALIANHNPSPSTSINGPAQIPSPTPGLIPSPVASPVSTTGTTEVNAGVVVPVPPGWSVDSKDSESIILTDPDGTGSVTIASGGSNPAQTAQDNKNTIDDYFKSSYPDARNCAGTSPKAATFNGASGIQWSVCFTLTASGHSVAAAAWLFAGANPSGTVYYIVMVATQQANLQNYLNVAKPVLQGVRWKLS